MVLWVDKYRPRELLKLDYHKKQAEQLKSLCKQNDFPHLLFYGPMGAGKKTRIMCLLRELYGPGAERLRNETMTFTTPSNRKIDVMIVSSNYHIEVNPSDAELQDRVVVVDLVKQVAQTHQIDVSGQRDFKVIVLTHVDELTKDAQNALRRTMEKYVATCRLILCVNSTSKVIPAVRSRCLGIRVGAPEIGEIISILQYIAKKENINLPIDFANRIAEKSDRNLRRAILMLETAKVRQYPFTASQEPILPDWQIFVRETANMMLQEQTIPRLEKIRERFYELLSQGIPSEIIFTEMVDVLVHQCDITLKSEIFNYAGFYEHRLLQANKHIFHLEAFAVKFMSIYKKYTESMMMDDF